MHNLPGRQDSYGKNLDEVFERAAQIDNILLLYLRKVVLEKKYPPLAFRSCRLFLYYAHGPYLIIYSKGNGPVILDRSNAGEINTLYNQIKP